MRKNEGPGKEVLQGPLYQETLPCNLCVGRDSYFLSMLQQADLFFFPFMGYAHFPRFLPHPLLVQGPHKGSEDSLCNFAGS